MTAWSVYILRCCDDTLYTGIASDLAKRLAAHGRGTAAKYTRSRRPVTLVYEEQKPDRSSALKREAAVRRLGRAGKLELISGVVTHRRYTARILTASRQRAPTLYGIVAFKLIRGALLLLLAMRVYGLVGEDLRPHFEAAVKSLRLDPETEFFDRLGDRIDAITPVNVGWAATGTLLYGLLSLAEGVGLALRTRWAGFLVVAESGFFVPLETYGLIKNPSLTILLILILNVTILVYLLRNRNRLFRHH